MLITSRVKTEPVNKAWKDAQPCSSWDKCKSLQLAILSQQSEWSSEIYTQYMWEWTWRTGNSPILFVRMKINRASMENSMEISLKTGNKTTTCCAVLSCSVVSDSLQPQSSPGKNTEVGCHALLQGIFLTQGPKPVSHSAGRSVIVWAAREARKYWSG